MKIRSGFVSNSSSSSFYFFFKGKTLKDLFKILDKHKFHFDIKGDPEYGDDVNVEKIKSALASNAKQVKKQTDLKEKIQECLSNLAYYEQELKDKHVELKIIKKHKDKEFFEYLTKKYAWKKGTVVENGICRRYEVTTVREIKDCEKRIEECKTEYKTLFNLSQQGLTMFKLECGDNHGDIVGGWGATMDYKRTQVAITADDLIILTESNH